MLVLCTPLLTSSLLTHPGKQQKRVQVLEPLTHLETWNKPGMLDSSWSSPGFYRCLGTKPADETHTLFSRHFSPPHTHTFPFKYVCACVCVRACITARGTSFDTVVELLRGICDPGSAPALLLVQPPANTVTPEKSSEGSGSGIPATHTGDPACLLSSSPNY